MLALVDWLQYIGCMPTNEGNKMLTFNNGIAEIKLDNGVFYFWHKLEERWIPCQDQKHALHQMEDADARGELYNH